VGELPKAALPPFNGYGTLDDSKQNCTSLVPKPPKRDMHKLMNKDKIILRFTCCMADTHNTKLGHSDADRVFVLSYFLMDDTLSIFEPPLRNSGIVGGKFLERSKVQPQAAVAGSAGAAQHPCSSELVSGPFLCQNLCSMIVLMLPMMQSVRGVRACGEPTYNMCGALVQVYKPSSEETFTYQDLYVGATLVIHGRGFKLTEADEYTYTYMENNKHIFVMADADAILRSLQVQVRHMLAGSTS
jgi:hypothetical protein